MILLWLFSIIFIGASTFLGIHLGIPLTVVLALFSAFILKHGKSAEELRMYIKEGCIKAAIVARILVMIGVNTSLWLSSGCIAGIIHYGSQFIAPDFFLLMCFLLCAMLSFMLGSAFATTATMGIIMYIVGCAGGVPPAMTAGAIISGIFVGDRCSPIASSLVLLASLNGVPHRDALRIVIKTSAIPILLSSAAYAILSQFVPADTSSLSRLKILEETFTITPIVLLPAAALLCSSLLRLRTLLTLCASIAAAIPLALFSQGAEPMWLINSILNGFRLPESHSLYGVMRGGGITPMLSPIYILMVSCSIAVIIEKGGVLSLHFKALLRSAKTRTSLYIRSVIIGTASAAIGCNQTVSIVTTSTLMNVPYRRAGFRNEDRLRDVSFASVVMSVIVPWTLAVSVPLSMLSFKGLSYMPYMFFIIICPIYNLLYTIFTPAQNPRRHP